MHIVPVPLLAVAQIVIDLVVILALVAAIIGIAGIIKDFLVDNLVDILIEMPTFDYIYNGSESGGILFHIYKQNRDMVIIPIILAGGIAWLFTGRFGSRYMIRISSEQQRPVTDGVPGFMRPKSPIYGEKKPLFTLNMGSDARGHWIYAWLAGLPARCIFCIVILLILPPIWDAAIQGSEWAASTILNPIYSGNDEYPCPVSWYTNGILDMSNPDMISYHESIQWLLIHSDEIDTMCRPELRVAFMLEQWGGQTKAIPPPIYQGGSFWEMLFSMGDNAADYIYRGFGEFFINVILGVIKAQAVVMSGTGMIVSNVIVDVAVATTLVFAPIYLPLMLIPWRNIGGGSIYKILKQFTPAVLVSAIIYPIEVAVLFAVSSNLLIYLLLSDYGNDILIVWLFGTAIMSMVVALPIVTLGVFSQIMADVTGRFTSLIQTAQGGMGIAAGILGRGYRRR